MKITAQEIEVYVDTEAMAKLRCWTAHAEGEVSGLGLVDEIWDHGQLVAFQVTDVFILEQTCTMGGTELDQQAIAKLLLELEEQKLEGRLKLWWHSHANFGVFWSNTDEANILRLTADNWMISLVLNKAWDVLARLDYLTPLRITLDCLPVHIIVPDEKVSETCKRQVDELVRHPAPQLFPIKGFNPHWSHNGPLDLDDPAAEWAHQQQQRTPWLLEEEDFR